MVKLAKNIRETIIESLSVTPIEYKMLLRSARLKADSEIELTDTEIKVMDIYESYPEAINDFMEEIYN